MSKGKVALFVEDIYNDLEFWYPYYRMKEAGFEVVVVGTGRQDVFEGKSGIPAKADISSDRVDVKDFAAVIIPGGYAPDKMRIDPNMLRIVREMMESGKVVASICHAGWVLVSAGVLKGKKATACKMIKDDLVNAGAEYLDQEVVVDGNLITSRVPDDLPAFCREILKKLG
ncbi:intracellular protease, PfpI family [Desulfotomaculum nigrificans CO-1-SRB]|uniref:Intracellular protease, PfpI family n=1 Tax=Desulfotomaculum nigrificans (strain DSM 14880 / VKM B-2319 / CO-1-SRB) TaxID=868595 RepID=F6B4E1_DESCC|nr:type 1 glutamine amidotransferase domain-containing protein [Desulfotomaculum nigrificans]AEF92964.1 intracellular protease, PfpI family [Desulfotomaculum nigrificans CO-1-SRB]